VNDAPQKGTCGEHDGGATPHTPGTADSSSDAPVLNHKVFDAVLDDFET
jgi:hypothetical protein